MPASAPGDRSICFPKSSGRFTRNGFSSFQWRIFSTNSWENVLSSRDSMRLILISWMNRLLHLGQPWIATPSYSRLRMGTRQVGHRPLLVCDGVLKNTSFIWFFSLSVAGWLVDNWACSAAQAFASCFWDRSRNGANVPWGISQVWGLMPGCFINSVMGMGGLQPLGICTLQVSDVVLGLEWLWLDLFCNNSA